MAKIFVEQDMKELPPIQNGTIMIHQDQPPFIVMATGVVNGDEFPGVALEDGSYGEQWIASEYRVFEGKITLEN